MATTSLQGAYDQTRRWIESNDPERAIGLAQHILQHYPNSLEAYRILGEAYLARRQLDKAQDAFERVLGSDPENIPAHVGLGITFERQGKLDRAVPEFEQAWEIKPDMAELRSQLLRLYADAWGSEHAQLRLSRAGLARLYAKGHMLPQAITEFRQVIADQPNRHDATIALAEALWRDGQEKESIALCRDILVQRPHSLKANLLLGYLLLAQGQPEGQHYWDTATQIDPFMTVAQAMFETLPNAPIETIELPEWDEAAWRRQQELERQPIPAATRPIPVPTIATSVTRTPASSAPANDDFLAVLLAGGGAGAGSSGPTVASALQNEQVAATPNTISPLPLNDLVMPAPSSDDDPLLAPFSLADLGLSEDEIAGFAQDSDTTQPGTISTAEAVPVPFAFAEGDQALPQQTVPTSEPTLTPFSLNDLGLSDDEIDSLNDLGQGQPEATAATSEPKLTPFSLSDLGLSDDEIASLDDVGQDQPQATALDAAREPTLTPLSLSDLGLSEDDIESLNDLGANDQPSRVLPTKSDPVFEPFSLSDLGLTDDEIASLDDASAQGTQADAESLGGSTSGAAPEQFLTDLLPFSLDEIDADDSGSSLPSSLQPFSLDQVGPEPARPNTFNRSDSYSPAPEPSEEDDISAQSGGYSWQQPPQRTRPSYLSSTPHRDPLMPEGESIFDKLKQRRGQEIEPAIEPALPVSSNEPPIDDRMLFSMDDVSLRDDLSSSEGSRIVPAEAALLPETPAAPANDDLNSGLSSGQIQPFSLTDLGLSPEEIAALGLGGSSGAAQNFSAMLDTEAPAAAPESPPLDDGSFDEIDFGTMPAAEPTQQQTAATAAESDDVADETNGPATIESLAPFSLADLGLSDEEIAELGLDDPNDDASGLRITEEELAGLDMGGDLDLSAIHSTPIDAPSTSDLLLDRLLALGREQGYVDIADIIAGVANPEAEAERIEQIGQLLHENNIKIYDGDEEVDMDAEYSAEEPADFAQIDFGEVAPVAREEPDMTPFSLADLGLSDEEIASLGLGEPATPAGSPAAAPATNQQAMTPFSFADLGLSDEEIASLGLAESVAPAEPSTTSAPSEPQMSPFSSTDVEPSDDDIAGLNVTSAATEGSTFTAPSVDQVAPSQVAANTLPVAQSTPTLPPAAQPMPEPAIAIPPVVGLVQPRQVAGLSNSLAEQVPALAGYLQQLQGNPANHTLRLSLARISGQIGQTEAAIQQYKNIIRQNVLLDVVVTDLGDLLGETDDTPMLQRIHRLLGDAYSKQGRIDEAMTEYNWTYDTSATTS